MTAWLDFEKPVLELEQKIQELRESAGSTPRRSSRISSARRTRCAARSTRA
jgi:acetyl-CoA carboxylase alpha subunit